MRNQVKSALFVGMAVLFLYPLVLPVFIEFSYWQNVWMYGLFGLRILFSYGIACSLFIDWATRCVRLSLLPVAQFGAHVFFGLLFIVPYGILDPSVYDEGIDNFATRLGVMTSLLFWLSNQVLAFSEKKVEPYSR